MSLNSSLERSNVFILRIVEGNTLQREGAADWNARSPRVGRVFVLGNSSNKDSFDLREYLDCFLMLFNLINEYVMCGRSSKSTLISPLVQELVR